MTAAPDPPAGDAAGAGRPRPAERAGGRRAYCLVVENERAGRAPGTSMAPPSRFEITSRETIVGRDPSCAIRLDNLFVSRRHARLLLRGAALHLDDLASTNVTRRNGDPVHTRVQVHPGDVLHFASVRCRLVEAAPHPGDEIAADAAAESVESGESGESGEAPESAGAVPAPDAAEDPAESAPAPVEPADETPDEAPDETPDETPDPVPAEAPSPEPAGGGESGAAEPDDPAPVPEAEPPAPMPEEAGGHRPAEDRGGGAPEAVEGAGVGGGEPAAEVPPEAADDRPAPMSPRAPIFVAGPLPGEPQRTRVRAVLWALALAALAALAALVLL